MNGFYFPALSEPPIPEVVPPAKGASQTLRSNGLGCRAIRSATAKHEVFAIAVNRTQTIGELWVLTWSAAFRDRR